jgi:hypothetical protein
LHRVSDLKAHHQIFARSDRKESDIYRFALNSGQHKLEHASVVSMIFFSKLTYPIRLVLQAKSLDGNLDRTISFKAFGGEMNHKLGILVVCLFLTTCASADERTELQIPVIGKAEMQLDPRNPSDDEKLKALLGDKGYAFAITGPHAIKGPIVVSKEQKMGNSKSSEVATIVKDMRAALCDTLKKGDEFKFTMAWDASAKVWGIGVSGNSGIEVTIKCGS